MTASNAWSADALSIMDGTGEVEVATRRSDDTLRTARIVWIVRHHDAVHVRSVNGTTAAWYRGVQTRHEGELSAGDLRREVVFVEAGEHAGDDGWAGRCTGSRHRDKYGRPSSAVTAIAADVARASTLRVDPARRPRLISCTHESAHHERTRHA